ncbi:hypothetical protein GALMADRAFT_224382 [Galerina marginata CBS 339.88]|uniref:Tetratricopeptide repeat protein 39B n=1 Tax=Galerina marginata (strain CBS 339.88) TaxID=685588 RepID=A0A067T6N1_GALM3|nr:hypothetical protein GALMADRAFT_224382 [Galerina marginata CBS 339.88]
MQDEKAPGSARSDVYPSSATATTPSSATPSTSGDTESDNTSTPGTPASATLSTGPTYHSRYTSPPVTQYPYTPEIALSDLPAVVYALDLFLSSKMLESEAYLVEQDGKMERLYIATGYGLIQCVKGLMSYEDADLLAGITHTKQGNHIASLHRKKAAFLGSRLAGYVVSSVSSALHPGSVQWIKSMTDIERHAELVYAESLFEKALLGIVYSGDWLAFIKEALNMRTTISVYRQLGSYIEHMDSLSPTGTDTSVDVQFRSGVLLGVGMSNIILSLMPGKLMTLVELFGYKGDRKYGLECLMKAGGWVDGEEEPRVSAAEEGVRRSICDMALLIFHLVLSSFTFEGVDIGVASKIVKWNLKRFPKGVFFLFGAGRLSLMRSQPAEAITYYVRAMESQQQYRNLHHISFWEIAIAHLSLWDLKESLVCWRDLEREATWSKAIYSYGMAVCLLEISVSRTRGVDKGADEEAKKNLEEAAKLMDKVPGLRQKIAGKSIPLEKFVARKARKFLAQNHRLALPALEMAYIFQGIAHAPRKVILRKMLPEVARTLNELGWVDELADVGSTSAPVSGSDDSGKGTTLKERKDRADVEKGYGAAKGGGYWDDFCLAMFLRGVCMRYVAYPDPDAELDDADNLHSPGELSKEAAEREAEASFKAVFEHGPKIELDHQLVYHAHYEVGRLYACQSHPALARAEFDLVLSGKTLEVGASGKKGKYSMENALHMRTHAAVDILESGGKGGRL